MENITMSESATTDTETAVVETSDDSTTKAAATEATTETTTAGGQQALGDAGKKALDAMKAERQAAKAELAEIKREFDAFKAKAEGKEAEFTAAQEAQRIKDEALAGANRRILNSEIKAAAKGVLADPQDAYKFLDLDSFEVDDNGNTDESAIASALKDLVEQKPYLAAQSSKRFQGTADGGARNAASAKPPQLTKADLERMSREGLHDEIVEAKKAGRFNDLLGIKP